MVLQKGKIEIVPGSDGDGWASILWYVALMMIVLTPSDDRPISKESKAMTGPCRDRSNIGEAFRYQALPGRIKSPCQDGTVKAECETVVKTCSDSTNSP
jgi:hypothetical protein